MEAKQNCKIRRNTSDKKQTHIKSIVTAPIYLTYKICFLEGIILTIIQFHSSTEHLNSVTTHLLNVLLVNKSPEFVNMTYKKQLQMWHQKFSRLKIYQVIFCFSR